MPSRCTECSRLLQLWQEAIKDYTSVLRSVGKVLPIPVEHRTARELLLSARRRARHSRDAFQSHASECHGDSPLKIPDSDASPEFRLQAGLKRW